MRISPTNNNQNPKFKAFIADAATAKKINQSITMVYSVFDKAAILGLESKKAQYSSHYLTATEFINYFSELSTENGGKYLDNILKKAKEVKLEDIEKGIPKMQAIKKSFHEAENKLVKELNLEA